MDKYENSLKLDQMKSLCSEGKYEEAAEVADSINWGKVKNANALVKAGEVYERVQRYGDSRDVLLMAYDRSPIGRMIIYRLAEVAVKMKDFSAANEYYEEFMQIAPHDSLKYIILYNIKKGQGVAYSELIPILEQFKEQEYSEEWAYELAYLYHKAGKSAECVAACDELILWFGDGPYVERALELKMLYQPLTKVQEEKYRAFRQQKDGYTRIGQDEMMRAGEYIHDPVVIPQVSVNSSRFNTTNLQQEIARGMEQIMSATEKETVSDTMDNIKKMVDEIPYLQISRDTSNMAQREQHIETDEEIDGSLKINFQELLGEDSDGQMSIFNPEGGESERQITGQLSIEDILEECERKWERTKRAAEIAMQKAEQRKLESAKARALQEAGDIMDRLNDVIPKLDAGVTPKELLEEEYLHPSEPEPERPSAPKPETERPSTQMPEPEPEPERPSTPKPEPEPERPSTQMPEPEPERPSAQMPEPEPERPSTQMPEPEPERPSTQMPEQPDTQPQEPKEPETKADAEAPEQAEAISDAAMENAALISKLEEAIEAKRTAEEIRKQETGKLFADVNAILEKEISRIHSENEQIEQQIVSMINTRRMPDLSRKIIRMKEEPQLEDLSKEDLEIAPAPWVPIAKLTEEQKAIFSYFVPVKGMEDQLCNALNETIPCLRDPQNHSAAYLIIQGGHGCGKTELARSIIRVLQKETGGLKGNVGKIHADALNAKDIQKLLRKLAGGCLIIENAGDMTRETAITLSLLLEQDKSGLLVILEDTSVGIKKALAADDGFAKKFKDSISVPIFTNEDLVAFAQSYARELGYEIDEVAILALHNRISNIQRLDQATTLTEVKDIVDEAIRHEEHSGIKKAFGILTAKRYTEDEKIILKERDFEQGERR